MNALLNSTRDTDWAQKYRPQVVEEVVMPKRLRDTLARLRHGGGMSLIFYGGPGTGKTSTACAIDSENTFYIDCSTQSSIKSIRKIISACSVQSVCGGKRIVILDEADSLRRDAQLILTGAIETLSVTSDFIAITNDLSQIVPALQSRLYPVCFNHIRDSSFAEELAARLNNILAREGRDVLDLETMSAVIRDDFPDIRRMLKKLQFETATKC